MIYEEFKHIKLIEDKNNPFCNLYEYEDGSRFYIEPVFYTKLMGFKELRNKEFNKILHKMEQVVKKNKKVVFCGDYEFPQTEAEDYIFLEITDITDPLQIFVEDKSRGSDYGD